MIGDNLRDALNQQITNELSAGLLLPVPGWILRKQESAWVRQLDEASTSGGVGPRMRIFNFVTDRGGRVTLGPIGAPASEFDSVEAAVSQALEHERRVTEQIYALHEVAQRERDYAAHVLLEWFAEEQVEEEKTLEELLDHVRMVGNDGAGLLIIDGKLGGRTSAE